MTLQRGSITHHRSWAPAASCGAPSLEEVANGWRLVAWPLDGLPIAGWRLGDVGAMYLLDDGVEADPEVKRGTVDNVDKVSQGVGYTDGSESVAAPCSASATATTGSSGSRPGSATCSGSACTNYPRTPERPHIGIFVCATSGF